MQDLYDKQLILGDTGPGTGTRSYPKALNELLGLKFKLVGGFPASSDVFLAMERGEVDGICESLDSIKISRPDWIPTKKISILFQGGASPTPSSRAFRSCTISHAPATSASDRIPLCRPGHRPSVRRAAGPAGGSPEDAARRLRRHHEGSGFRRRGPEIRSSTSIPRTASISPR